MMHASLAAIFLGLLASCASSVPPPQVSTTDIELSISQSGPHGTPEEIYAHWNSASASESVLATDSRIARFARIPLDLLSLKLLLHDAIDAEQVFSKWPRVSSHPHACLGTIEMHLRYLGREMSWRDCSSGYGQGHAGAKMQGWLGFLRSRLERHARALELVKR
ncbi:MAG: hypothetical protein ACXWP5_01380 [Bdellovibrionota bacterium]